GLHRAGARGAAAGGLRGRDALVLLRLRVGHLGGAAARPRSPRALVRALASRRLGEAVRRRRGGVRRRAETRGPRRIPVDRSRTRAVPRGPGRRASTSLRSLSHERTGLARGIEVLGLAPRTPNGQQASDAPGSRNGTDRTTFLVHCVGVRSSVVAAEALALLFSCSILPERSRELVRAACPERRARSTRCTPRSADTKVSTPHGPKS